jgi:lipopolysaccharide export system protein LptA
MRVMILRDHLRGTNGSVLWAGAALIAIGCLTAFGALAQSVVQGVPNAMQGFSQNRDKPIQIDAGSLEVRDKDKAATFKDNVKVVQGDTTMRCKVMVVFYEGGANPSTPAAPAAKPAMTSATPGPTGSSSIKRLEAKGGVIVTQKDQTVTGETAIFDMKTNTVTMTGGVVLTRGDNVLRGDKLVVDMTTGVSRVEGKNGVQALIPSAAKGATAAGGPTSVLSPSSGNETTAAAKPAPATSKKPLNLNELTQPESH